MKKFLRFFPRETVYLNRWKVLQSLGYGSYREYLESPLWAYIRSVVLKQIACRVCKKKAFHVHHLSYARDVLLGKDMKALVPLCVGCHHRIEFTQQGHKRTFRGALMAYNGLMAGEQV